MTRDEAIEKAFEHVRMVMGENEIFRIMIAGEKGEIVAYEKHFPFDPPRRIPTKGTPVMDKEDSTLAFSMGELCDDSGLCVVKQKSNLERLEPDFLFYDWIELAEVQ